jgi:manganese efflux pump family protein
VSLQHLFILLALLLPLSLDTFILSAALGLAGLPQKERVRTSLILSIFEAGMPIVGVLVAHGIGDMLGRFAGYTAAIVIALIGLLALTTNDEKKEQQRLKMLAHARGLAIIDLGISISVDELAIGAGLGLIHIPLFTVVIFLGIQSFAAAQLGLWLGGRLNDTLRESAERVAGFILISVAIALIILKVTGHEI